MYFRWLTLKSHDTKNANFSNEELSSEASKISHVQPVSYSRRTPLCYSHGSLPTRRIALEQVEV